LSKPCNAATYRLATLKLALEHEPKVIVEVGVYGGALSALLATVPTLEKQFIVDSWEGGYSNFDQKHMDGIAAGVHEWAKTQPKLTVHHMRSLEGAKLFADESIDFFHTDGDHSLEGITSDLKAWLPKVKKGGILSGDNYEIAAVAKGVSKLLPGHTLRANGRLWVYVKP
jgi:predicted O-methyltransferase YrrM